MQFGFGFTQRSFAPAFEWQSLSLLHVYAQSFVLEAQPGEMHCWSLSQSESLEHAAPRVLPHAAASSPVNSRTSAIAATELERPNEEVPSFMRHL